MFQNPDVTHRYALGRLDELRRFAAEHRAAIAAGGRRSRDRGRAETAGAPPTRTAGSEPLAEAMRRAQPSASA